MTFQKKLLILLLCLSILPILLLRTFGIHQVRTISAELVAQFEQHARPPTYRSLATDSNDHAAAARVRPPDDAFDMVDLIERRTRKIESLTAGFLLLLSAVGAVVAVFFSKMVTRPIEAITGAAQKLAAGDLKTKVHTKTGGEIGKLAQAFNDIGPRLDHAQRIQRSVEIASEIQRHLLPRPPRVPGLDIFGITLSSSELAGGDYYDYLCQRPQDKQLCVAIGDVSDHGMPAALLMASARSALRVRSLVPGRLEEIVADINHSFCEDVASSGYFMTFFLLRIDAARNQMQWVRAGHDPGILYDSLLDRFETLAGKGLPLGVQPTAAYQAHSAPIAKGQIIFLGTDGIWEARNAEGILFGKDRIHQMIRENALRSAQTIALSVMDEVAEFQASAEREDDITCVVIKLKQ